MIRKYDANDYSGHLVYDNRATDGDEKQMAINNNDLKKLDNMVLSVVSK
jgi:hypothetical protein